MRPNLSAFDELEWLIEPEEEWESYGGSSTSESKFIGSAIRRGTTDENSLTDLVFFRRHPERNGRSISSSERNYQTLAREWLRIRDTLVRPLLRTSTSSRPSTTPTPSAPVSGSVAARIVDEARSHIGFQEGPNNDNPFSEYFNVPNVPWCAYFVSYVYTKAGIPLNIGSSDAMLDHLRARGQFFSNTTVPQPADVVIFDWTQGDHDPAEHVGLVEKVYRSSSGQTRVGTIEGNSGDGVNRRDYPLGDRRIVGFGRLAASGSVTREFDVSDWMSELENAWEFEMESPVQTQKGFTLDDLPPSLTYHREFIRKLILGGSEKTAVGFVILNGKVRDENKLSDLVFFVKHPERNGRRISKNELKANPTLKKEWLSIRDAIVRPTIPKMFDDCLELLTWKSSWKGKTS